MIDPGNQSVRVKEWGGVERESVEKLKQYGRPAESVVHLWSVNRGRIVLY